MQKRYPVALNKHEPSMYRTTISVSPHNHTPRKQKAGDSMFEAFGYFVAILAIVVLVNAMLEGRG